MEVSYRLLEPGDVAGYRSLAFPRHQPLLRHDIGASGTILAVGASRGAACGLALAGPTDRETASVHAVVVAPEARHQGVGAGLLEALEAAVRARGVRRLVASHRGDRPMSGAVSRLLARRGFVPVRSVIEIIYPMAPMIQAPYLDLSCPGAAVVAYSPERLAPLLQAEEPSGMAPANVAPEDNDPVVATLVAMDGEVAACVLGRQQTAETVYMSLLYVRPELRRSHLSAFALKAFLGRMLARGFTRFSCEISTDNDACLGLAVTNLGEYAEHRALVHMLGKLL